MEKENEEIRCECKVCKEHRKEENEEEMTKLGREEWKLKRELRDLLWEESRPTRKYLLETRIAKLKREILAVKIRLGEEE